MKKVRIKFNDHTPVDIHAVGKAHIGRVQLRPHTTVDPNRKGSGMEYYFPAGTEIDIPDYVASGLATVVPSPVVIEVEPLISPEINFEDPQSSIQQGS